MDLDQKTVSKKYRVIFFKANLKKDFILKIKEEIKKNINDKLLFSKINNTGELLNKPDPKIIITSANSLKKNIINFCGNSPVILLGNKNNRLRYKKIIEAGYYDLLNIHSNNFNKDIIQSISSAIKDYETLNKKNIISKGLYFANVIHELRSPLNSIIGYTSILNENENETSKKNSIKTVLESSKYMLSIINDTLDFTKLQSGKMEINDINFILKNTLEHLFNVFNIQSTQKNIDFILDYSNNCPVIIEGDEFRFTQIIINLLSNSFKFTPENGKIKLVCNYENDFLIITISDNGPGIPENKLDRIFLPFEQTSKKIASSYGGTGLGLAITKQLVILMGGQISASSEINKGSTFTLKLPFKAVIEDFRPLALDKDEEMILRWINKLGNNIKLKNLILNAIRNLPERMLSLNKSVKSGNIEEVKFAVHKLKGFTGSYGFLELYEIFKSFDKELKADIFSDEMLNKYLSMIDKTIQAIPDKYINLPEQEKSLITTIQNSDINILFVDDLEENRDLFNYYMNILKISCDIAQNKEEAINLVNKNHYHIIMLDLQMPDISGFDLINLLKKIKPSCYYIAATGDTDEYTINKLKYSNFNAYLFKPFTDSNIQNEINKYLKLQKPK